MLVKANAASLFRIIYTESDSTCHANVNGEVEYCTAECPCAVALGPEPHLKTGFAHAP